MKRKNRSKRNDTDMSYIDSKFTVETLFQPIKQYDKTSVEPDSRFLWEWDKTWNMFKR